MADYSLYVQKFKIALGILFVSLVIAIFLIFKTYPEIVKINDAQNAYKTNSEALVDAERKLENLKNAKKNEEKVDENVIKAFFKPINGGVDTESVITDEVGEILQIMRENKIKARSLKFDPDPADDNFVQHVPERYHVCRVTADMIASYGQLESFLRELFKHEHFLDISSIEITPYDKNKRILLVNLQLKLYAVRDKSSVASVPEENNGQEQKSRKKRAKADGEGTPPDIQQQP